MTNPFHNPEKNATYTYRVFDEDKKTDMNAFMSLLTKAQNIPDICGIHQHDIREVSLGLGSVDRKHVVIYWEAEPNGV